MNIKEFVPLFRQTLKELWPQVRFRVCPVGWQPDQDLSHFGGVRMISGPRINLHWTGPPSFAEVDGAIGLLLASSGLRCQNGMVFEVVPPPGVHPQDREKVLTVHYRRKFTASEMRALLAERGVSPTEIEEIMAEEYPGVSK